MSQIDELIDSYCPDGIAFKEIGELSKIQSGGTPSSKNSSYYNGDIHWSAVNDVTSAKMYITSTKKTITKAGLDNSSAKIFPAGTLLLTIYATLGAVAITEKEMATNQAILGILPDETVDVRFLYYVMQNSRELLISQKQAGSQNNLNRGIVSKFKVPVPPLKIQRHIADILDTFSKMEAELEAELEARKQQYDHYRRNLLAPTGKYPVLELHEIADFTNAKAHEKLVHPDGTVALMTARFISRGVANRYVMPEDVLTPAFTGDVALVMSDLPNGRALARTFFVDEDEKYAANQRVCLLRSKDSEHLSPRYLHYIMNRNKQLLAYDSGVDQTHLKKDYILKVRLEVPPVEEQRRIVDILDKFDALVNDLSVGLPAELAARRQQYEYYRDKLLTFKQLEPAS